MPRPQPFSALDILGAMLTVGVVTWFATPILQSQWRWWTSSPAEIARVEGSIYYNGCSEARAAGAAPIHRGSPGYRPDMDGDQDGIACE